MPKARAKRARSLSRSASPIKREDRTQPSRVPAADLAIYLALALAIFIVYSQVLHFEFVTYDDPDYVTNNPHVQAGLSPASIAWAFTSSFAGNWFPLTWLSHMLDWQLFGNDSGLHHLINVLIHAISSLLWFAVLKRMTGARWRSATVAFLFALHPLHVESVAWVAERKDVLSGLFCVSTLWSYAALAARPSRAQYILTLVLFCLGLMAKPMLVTLPLVLLLLDQWPLRRGFKVVEKIPFLLASAAVSVITYVVHQKAGATASFEMIPAVVRLENALVSYVVYILQAFWPVRLAVFYPYPLQPIVIPAVIAAIVVLGISVVVLRVFRRFPYLAVGWFWYLITLLPVIGLIQVGAQARADRYTYIPLVGIAIAAVWGIAQALEPWPRVRLGLAAAVCASCLVLTSLQVSYWRDSTTLYQHAISVVPESYVARFNLASVLEDRGDHAEAIAQLRETTRTRPRFALAHAELGQLLAQEGQPEQGIQELETAVHLKPDLASAHFRLGSVLGSFGKSDQAATEFADVIHLEPENADAHFDLALALAQQGKLQEAVSEFSATIRLAPNDADARFNLGVTLAKLGRFEEAIRQLSEAVRLRPDFAQAREALSDLTGMKEKSAKQ